MSAHGGRDDTGRDLPGVLLGTCVTVLGGRRPDWGQAMLAELAGLQGRRSRWGFALGCMRATVFAMPPTGPLRTVTAAAHVAAAASVALVAAALVRYPGLVTGPGTWVALGWFVALLVAYVFASTNLAARLVDGRLLRTAGGAGAAIATSWVLIGLGPWLNPPTAVSMAMVLLAPLTAVAGGWSATTRSGSLRAGLGCTGLAALVAGVALFLLWTGETVATGGRPYDPGLLRDFTTSAAPDLATYAVSDSLGSAMMLLLVVPLVSLLGGLVGSAIAARTHGRLPVER